jgi:hypothetical protein
MATYTSLLITHPLFVAPLRPLVNTGYRSGGNLAIGAAVGLVPAAALKLILGAIMIISAVRIFRK